MYIKRTLPGAALFAALLLISAASCMRMEDDSRPKSSDNRKKLSFDLSLWEIPEPLLFSAYYPYVDAVGYSSDLDSYSIAYKTEQTEAGPTVSKTVESAIRQLNLLPLVFQHITNDIGYMISDVTPDPQLQGLIHLRKLTAFNVASAGIFTNDIANSRGAWKSRLSSGISSYLKAILMWASVRMENFS